MTNKCCKIIRLDTQCLTKTHITRDHYHVHVQWRDETKLQLSLSWKKKYVNHPIEKETLCFFRFISCRQLPWCGCTLGTTFRARCFRPWWCCWACTATSRRSAVSYRNWRSSSRGRSCSSRPSFRWVCRWLSCSCSAAWPRPSSDWFFSCYSTCVCVCLPVH